MSNHKLTIRAPQMTRYIRALLRFNVNTKTDSWLAPSKLAASEIRRELSRDLNDSFYFPFGFYPKVRPVDKWNELNVAPRNITFDIRLKPSEKAPKFYDEDIAFLLSEFDYTRCVEVGTERYLIEFRESVGMALPIDMELMTFLFAVAPLRGI